MVSTSDLEKWQTATNGINESGQKELNQEEWSALVTLNGCLQNGNFNSDESRQALILLKNNLSQHNSNQILLAHMQNFIALCEQYLSHKCEPVQQQVPPPPLTFRGIPNKDIPNWQKAIQGIEAGRNNLSPKEIIAFNSLREQYVSGNLVSNENSNNIQILKNSLPSHSSNRLLQAHLKNFVTLYDKYLQANRQTPLPVKPINEPFGADTKASKSKGGSNKVLIFIIAAFVVGYLVYSNWSKGKETVGTKTALADSTRVDDNVIKQTTTNSAQQSNPITSVITPWTRFTNTFVTGDGGYYVISNIDGNLYFKGNNKDALIIQSVKEIYTTAGSFFAIKNDGSLWVWGDNSVGQLGDNTGINKTLPIKIMDNVKDINIQNTNNEKNGSIFVLKNDGKVYAWGKNQNGQLGVGDNENKYEPIELPLENVSYIFNTHFLNIAITQSGDVYNISGKPNLVDRDNYNKIFGENIIPYKLNLNGDLYKDSNLFASNVAFTNIRVNLYAGIKINSYVTKNGGLYSWGESPIGDGSNIPRKNPVLVLQNVIQSGVINNNRIALTSEGKLYMVNTKNTYKYESVASDVYLLSLGERMPSAMSDIFFDFYGYFTNDGSFYTYGTGSSENFSPTLLLKDVALPKIKYVITPLAEQSTTNSQTPPNISSGKKNLSYALSTQILTEDDLLGLSKQELRILRNEIFARHGYIFKSQDLRGYFSTKDWYKPQYNDVTRLLNTIEQRNVAFIQRHE